MTLEQSLKLPEKQMNQTSHLQCFVAVCVLANEVDNLMARIAELETGQGQYVVLDSDRVTH